MTENDLLQEFTRDIVPAEKNLRFFNWLVDTIIIYILIALFAILLGFIAPDFIIRVANDNPADTLWWYLICIVLFVGYYAFQEGLGNGKTIGKRITRTRALRQDGNPLTTNDAFRRSLSRVVPFELFSGFAERPWHDKWTDTVVVKDSTI